MTRVFFNQNIISPYRLPLFEELEKDYDVTVWFHRKTSEDRKWETELEDYNFDSEILRNFQLGPLTLNPGFFLKLLRRDFDVYFINENPSTFLSSFAILLSAKLRRKPVAIWSETIDTEKSQEFPENHLKKIPVKIWRSFKESYRKILFRFSDRFVAFSQMAEEFLVRRGVPQEKINTQIQVMPEKLLPEPENHNLNDKYSDQEIILSLGYLEERKGVQDLIKAFKQIEGDNYRLVIAGTGPYEEELKKKADDDEKIEFVGYLSKQEKANYYDAADLFVLPTHHDPWGLVINEALHYGTRAITTEAAGAKELLDQRCIFLEGDIEELKEIMDEHFSEIQGVDTTDIDKGVNSIRESIEIELV